MLVGVSYPPVTFSKDLRSPQRIKSNLGLKHKRTYPQLKKNLLQPLVVLADDPSLVLSQEVAPCDLSLPAADQIMDIIYFFVQLTKCFLEHCQPAGGVSCVQSNLGRFILNLGKMQLLGTSTDQNQITVTTSYSVICNAHLSNTGSRFYSQVCTTSRKQATYLLCTFVSSSVDRR